MSESENIIALTSLTKEHVAQTSKLLAAVESLQKKIICLERISESHDDVQVFLRNKYYKLQDTIHNMEMLRKAGDNVDDLKHIITQLEKEVDQKDDTINELRQRQVNDARDARRKREEQN